MKKMKVFSLMLCLCLLLGLLTGCSPKISQTAQGFTDVMEAAGFTVVDVTENTETNGLATKILVATNDNYQIEFWQLTDSETGAGAFNQNKQIFDNEYSVRTMSLEVTMENYSYYAFNSGGDFHLVTRIDHTMLYSVANAEYREEIVELVKTLGYK